MADCSKNTNPLRRSGLNRSERKLPGLDPDFALPDERRLEDWMVYARDIAAYVKYYNNENTWADKANWQTFFDADVSAQLALIAVQDIGLYKDRIRSLFEIIQGEELKNDAVQLQKQFGLLYSGLLSLAYRIDYFYTILPEDVGLKKVISNLVQVKLAPVLRRLLGYYRAADEYYSPRLLLETVQDKWIILAYPQQKAKDILAKGFSEKWWFKQHDAEVISDWNDYYTNKIQADKTIYQHAAAVVPDAEVWQVLNHAVNHNLFSAVFAEFLTAYARIVSEAGKLLINTITAQSKHEPHYALYLAFLQLLKQAQGSVNTYTKRHLDYYYKEILRLVPLKAQPNRVHIALELSNTTSEHLLKKGTAFKAGKDSAGKDVIYKSDEDIVVNKAKVAQLCSFYRADGNDKLSGISQSGLLYASPVANSADGAGAKLTTAEMDWHPFANKVYTDGRLSGINMPATSAGFAFATHYLFLKEGERKITVTLYGATLSKLSGKKFKAFLTTEKGWLEKDASITAVSASQAAFTVTVTSADAPITAFLSKVHLDKFTEANVPVIKFLLSNTAGNNQYEELKDVEISSVDIKVMVGEPGSGNAPTGLKELLVATDLGTVDPSKPFLPFGQNPKKGAGLIIGSKEVFSKKNSRFKLFIEWAELIETIQAMDVNTVSDFFPSAQVKFLQNGVWTNGTFTSILNNQNSNHQEKGVVELFWGANSLMMANVHLPTDATSIPAEAVFNYESDYLPYNISSQNGFLKLELNADFQWDDYYMQLQKYLINLANGITSEDDNPVPVKPYLPKIQAMRLAYESGTSVSFTATDQVTCYHVYPFGVAALGKANLVSGKLKLMPQFVHTDTDPLIGRVHHQAEFYIGLQNVVPAQKVNILFKVLDGSTDPLSKKPEEHVSWSYLSNNAWVDFDPNEINDTTQQLISTGIISFPIPDAATSTNSLLPAGYYWIKAGVAGLTEQVCRLIDVRAQVVQATFYDQQNASDFLSQALPAGSISKLQEPDPAVKKVEQPYAAFGGRYYESSDDYYTRVSERLRHKNRAITIRDVEQLVLENFKDLHKVKCLNHTRFDLGATPVVYNELAPGHVTVITIPELTNKNAINPLRPYTDRSTLTKIRDFLLEKANCNMKWYVENPQFEEVRIETTIVLTDAVAGNDAFYVTQLQNDLLRFFTPWAYNQNTDIKFGGKIAKSAIINFIEELSYVEVMLDLKMYHNKQDGSAESGDMDEVSASTARSILVSVPASAHKVSIVKKTVKAEASECN